MKEKPQVERQVVIQREGRAPLGINIVNTADINPRPGAIFKVVSDGVAAQHGILDSDVIASINGLQTESMTHAEVIAEMGRCGNTIDLVLLSGNFPHNMVAVAARTPVAAPRSGPLSPLWTDDVKPPGSATSVSPSLRTLVIARGNKQSLGMALTETAQGTKVTNLVNKSPAVLAGVMIHDLIVAVNGVSVVGRSHHSVITAITSAGDPFEVTMQGVDVLINDAPKMQPLETPTPPSSASKKTVGSGLPSTPLSGAASSPAIKLPRSPADASATAAAIKRQPTAKSMMSTRSSSYHSATSLVSNVANSPVKAVTLNRTSPASSLGLALAEKEAEDAPFSQQISNIRPGSPADVSGAQIGDVIVQINGKSTHGMSRDEVISTLGNAGQSVEVVVGSSLPAVAENADVPPPARRVGAASPSPMLPLLDLDELAAPEDLLSAGILDENTFVLIALAEGTSATSSTRVEKFVKKAVAVLVDGGINARGAIARPKSSGDFRAALSRGIKPPSPEAKILITWPQLEGKFYVAPSGSANSSNSILAFFSAVIDPNSRRTFVLASFGTKSARSQGSSPDPAKEAIHTVLPAIVAAAARAATPASPLSGSTASTPQSRPASASPAPKNEVPTVPPTSSMQLIGTTFVRRNKAELGFTLLEFNHEIDEMVPGGIAARAGIKPGDRVFTVNGLELVNKDHDDVVAAFQSTIGMKSFPVEVLRELQGLESIGEGAAEVPPAAVFQQQEVEEAQQEVDEVEGAQAPLEIDEGLNRLEVNDQVQTSKGKVGEIAFIGETEFASQIWVGVVFPKTIGKNDGSVKGVRYFRCRPRHGAFFRPESLTLMLKRPPTAKDITKASSLYKQGPRNAISPIP